MHRARERGWLEGRGLLPNWVATASRATTSPRLGDRPRGAFPRLRGHPCIRGRNELTLFLMGTAKLMAIGASARRRPCRGDVGAIEYLRDMDSTSPDRWVESDSPEPGGWGPSRAGRSRRTDQAKEPAKTVVRAPNPVAVVPS